MEYRNGISRREYIPYRRQRSVHFFVLLLMIWSVFCFILVDYYSSPVLLYRPSFKIQRLIGENAKRFGLTEEQLEAVIVTESRYDMTAVSDTGAQGLMQLMPDTAAWISKESGLPATDLHKPEENIPLGAWYLEYLLKKYEGNQVFALAAYNAGHGNVDAWIKEYGWTNDFADTEKIPFPETREFVRQVLENCEELIARKGE